MSNKSYHYGDPAKHKKSDEIAKKEIVEWLKQINVKNIQENKREAKGDFTQGKWDIHFKYKEKIIRNEGEARPDWSDPKANNPFDNDPIFYPWPYVYNTVTIPHRKHWTEGNIADFYWVACTRFPILLRLNMKKVRESEKVTLIEKPCNNSDKELEKFYKVPCELGTWFKKVDGLWVNWFNKSSI